MHVYIYWQNNKYAVNATLHPILREWERFILWPCCSVANDASDVTEYKLLFFIMFVGFK